MEQNSTVRKRDMGIAGILLILSQIFSSYQSTEHLSNKINELQDAFEELKSNQEKYFVRKEELKKVVKKIDKMNEELVKLSKQIDSIASYDLYDREELFGCVLEQPDSASVI